MSGTPLAQFSSNSAVLAECIELKYYMTFDPSVNIEDVVLVLEYESVEKGSVRVEISGKDFVYQSDKNRYYAKLTTMATYDIGQLVTSNLYENGVQISNGQLYSIEMYARTLIQFYESSDENLVNLLNAMVRFGRSSRKYFLSTQN